MHIHSLEDVKRASLCVGCGICEALSGRDKVRMELDDNGFYRPRVLQSAPEAWAQIKSVCPGISVRQDNNPGITRLERLWGPIQSAWVGHSTDEQIRWQASSGGALSAILLSLLETGQVDRVVHVGADRSNPFLTAVCQSRTREQVVENAGSRYAPVTPLTGLTALLAEEQVRFAFVGRPCDIVALRAYGKLNPTVEQRIVALVSFLCAGVPSLLATYDLVHFLGVSKDEVKQFRYRGFGWPGRATAVDANGKEYSASYEDSWGKILGRRLPFRCKICPDGVGELADVVCGDAWHMQNGMPSFEERPGRSLILARTTVGQHLVEEALAAGFLQASEYDLQDLEVIQPYQKNRRQAIAPRLFALRLVGRPVPQYKGFFLLRNAWDAGLPFFLKQVGGMLRRLGQSHVGDSL